ncbi:MAG: HypC/HybG/HupF family hydrogenase formation chaperone [Anaerolineales bacterium]|nr:HypC/HybG/HupF family hydrogenase formation chaperone [Anaerolineales bacterium]
MCLGIPGRVLETYEQEGLLMGKVDFGGATRETCLMYVPDIKTGEYVIVHVGFAINRLSEEEAQETLAALREVYILGEEIGPEGVG